MRPTDQEIFNAHVFEEPLVPVDGGTTAAENAALARALTAYAAADGPEGLRQVERFTRDFPRSAWRTAVLVNLGLVYRRTGYFSRALDAFEGAWESGRSASAPRGMAIANRALVELADLNSRLGRRDAAAALLSGVEGREIGGSASEMLLRIQEGRQLMAKDPARAVRCGPYSLARILSFLHPTEAVPRGLLTTQSTADGSSLVQMAELAPTLRLRLQMARRDPGAPLPLPAMIHWRVGHFAAVLERSGAHYRIEDPAFGGYSVTAGAIDEESSGYFLVPEGPLPPGWHPVDSAVGAHVRGAGYYAYSVEPQTPDEPHTSCPRPSPMAAYRLSLLNAGVNIYDVPVSYAPPVGPPVTFRVDYNQRDVFQPTSFNYSNLGPKWTFGWLSYVLEDDSSGGTVKLYARGGGQSKYTGLADNVSDVDARNQSVLVRTSASPIRYERRLPDGSVEVFSVAIGAIPARKVFLTQILDPQGNALTFTYDGMMRLTDVADALGQHTTVHYDNADVYKITKVTDPFGRFATFEYTTSGRLARITDPIGISSSFTHDSTDFITAMNTPYGQTTFASYTAPAHPPGQVSEIPRWVQATDPLGGRERVEFTQDQYDMPDPDLLNCQPDGIPNFAYLWSRNTHYWNRRAMALIGPRGPRNNPGTPEGAADYSLAHIYHWVMHDHIDNVANAVLESERPPLDSRIWYMYYGQGWPGPYPNNVFEGTMAKPIAVARKFHAPGTCLPGVGTNQIYRYEYNAVGKMINAIDAAGREKRYTYGINNVPDSTPLTGTGLDLLKVEQKTGTSTYVTLSTATYNDKHQPLAVTDAAGQTTTYTYNTAGQVLTVTTPQRAGISEDRTTTYEYDSSGYLQSVTRPAAGAVTRYAYDGYGRIATVTESDGYTLAYDYDALDRPTRVTYPDGTYEETVYNRLDAEKRRDRLGRWSQTLYDALRRPTLIRDTAGRTTRQEWCTCGSLDKVIDPNGNATKWTRDLQSRVLTETRADNKTWTYSYEFASGRLQTRTDPNAQVTTYEYFVDNNLKKVSYSGNGVDTNTPTLNFTWDPIYDRLSTRQAGAETPTVLAYHPITTTPTLGAGQLASVDGPLTSDTVSYVYDERGRIASRGLPGFMTSLNYDALGRVASEVTPVGTFTYAYEGTASRPLSLSYPNSQATQYTYLPDAGDHRLQRIKHLAPAGSTISQYDYTYNAIGDILTWTQQVGTGTPKIYGYEYDAADQLISAKHVGPPPLPVPGRYAYAYDPAGNRIAEQPDNNVNGATFNNRNQLVSRQPGGALLFRGTLNEPGTVTVQTTPAQVAPNNAFVAQAPVPPTAGNISVVAKDYSNNTRTNVYQVQANTGSTVNYTYDFNGNLTSDGTKTYEWDGENRLVAVKQGASTLASFTYDGASRRATKTAAGITTSYVYDGVQFLEERPGTGTTKRYVYGPGVDRPFAQVVGTATSYFLGDHLGSIVQVTNSSGATALSREYDPWGNLLQGTALSGYAFTGREWDFETGLYYYRARYYDPKVGRFLSEDPAGYAEGLNLSIYVKNQPVRFTDPTGLKIWVCNRKAQTTPGGNHAYFWDDRDKSCCGMNSSSGVGWSPRECSEPGPPTDECRPVDGSDGRESEIMKCCEATANNQVMVPPGGAGAPMGAPLPWLPWFNDCHTAVDSCLKKAGLTNPGPPGGRFGPPCDPCTAKGGQGR